VVKFSPHNIQVAPNGKSVWVTANAEAHAHSSRSPVSVAYAHGDNMDEMMAMMSEGEMVEDVIVIIDPEKDEIVKWLPIEARAHLAHVAFTKDSTFAYITAQTSGKIYKMNTETHELEAIITASPKSEPHGVRVGSAAAYVALLKGKALGIINQKNNKLTEIPLRGQPVQVGITPDEKYVVASLYDTKELAVYNIDLAATARIKDGAIPLDYIKLPASSRGPIQMYPTPDSKFFYLADQGYYFGEPSGTKVYKVDLEIKKVVKEIETGNAPHGVVVSHDGKMVYVTNLLGGDVSVIATDSDEVIARIKVGEEPNGISVWSGINGGAP
jgi:YVTN family beta-propeller protein